MRAISDWLPLTNAVELVRPLFMDQWPDNVMRHGLVLVVTTAVAFWAWTSGPPNRCAPPWCWW